MEDEKLHTINEPDLEYGHYSYADYLRWKIDDMMELIRGKAYKWAAAAPGMSHQKVSVRLTHLLHEHLKSKPCQVFHAPFDVRLPVKSKKNKEIDTVLQPDLCVICDESKLDEAGCMGAPDLVVEILSPGNNRKELKLKYEVYEESGVKEYWIIQPTEQTLLIYTLINGKYQPSHLYTSGDEVESKCIDGFRLNLSEIFEG
ncbi:Uma2 family endonuclease [Algoriphagus taiwanensis]|uniref:Uma2 family endonuclease n=1 Tax=Algoriphagus taiwanensis TaxID=1445656 RepID=A0ABQ6PZV2_9BACT|nr:Uma2 family endonuclease [Algoriphagus taiwanensis]